MPIYIILSKLTDEGRKTIKQRPERMLEVNRELEIMGVRVKEQFAVLGPYDFINIVEAPDNETVLKMSKELKRKAGGAHPFGLAAGGCAATANMICTPNVAYCKPSYKSFQ